jgi:phosphopantothenoylcysteine decarboxylase/phosphopantothenate--cysteine ligase
MAAAVRAALGNADVLVMAAAPADFRPRSVAASKLKKAKDTGPIETEPTEDILVTTRDARPAGCFMVGFALETDDMLANAAAKLEAKDLDMIVANDAREPGAGFGSDTNHVTVLVAGKPAEVLPVMTKDAVADAILDRVEERWRGTAGGR